MIQGPSKLKNYILRRLFKPLRLAKFESFWIRVCAIVAISGIPGDGLLISLSFSWQSFLKWFLFWFPLPSSRSFPPIYSVIFRVPGNYWFPVLPPWYQSPFCAHHPEGWVFPVSHFFLPFGAVFSKAHGWLSISECTGFWCHVLHGSAFGRPSSLSFFSNGRNPILSVWKSFATTPLFIALHSDSPRYRPLALWEVTPGFLLFLAGSLVPEKDVSIICFLCSFGFSFELS